MGSETTSSDCKDGDQSITRSYDGAYSYRSCKDHLKGCVEHWKAFVIGFVTVFGVLAGIIEAAALLIDWNPQRPWAYPGLVSVALIGGMVYMVFQYLNTPPAGLESYPKSVQRIAIVQRPCWEFKLAWSLLNHDVAPLDSELSEIRNGTRFIENHGMKATDYPSWIGDRTTNLLRMVDTAKQLLVIDAPGSVFSMRGQPATIPRMVESMGRLTRFYKDLIEFETNGRRVRPPKALLRVHEIHLGWTDVIQSGLHQLMDFLKLTSLSNPKSDNKIRFTIKFGSPPGMEEFQSEMERLTEHPYLLFMDE